MRSSFDILSALYQVLRPVLKPELSGDCYLHNEPEGDQKENVSIGMLNNPIEYVQDSTVNVNIHVMGLSESIANSARMRAILNLIIPQLDNADHLVDGTTLHTYIQDDKGVYRDRENNGKFFYNLRIKCVTL